MLWRAKLAVLVFEFGGLDGVVGTGKRLGACAASRRDEAFYFCGCLFWALSSRLVSCCLAHEGWFLSGGGLLQVLFFHGPFLSLSVVECLFLPLSVVECCRVLQSVVECR